MDTQELRTTKKKLIPEILNEVKKETSFQAKVKTLSNYKNRKDLKAVMKFAYNDKIVSKLPKGKPDGLELNTPDTEYQNIGQVIKYFPIFCNSPKYEGMNQMVREKKFLEILETISEDEAEVLIEMKDGKFKGISEKVVKEVFPDIFQ